MYYQKIVLILLLYDSKMEELITENELKKFRESDICNKDYDKFRLRLWLLNNTLKDGSDIYNFFFDLGIENKDDMANELIEGFFMSLN